MYFLEKEYKWMASFMFSISILSFCLSLSLNLKSASYILEWNILTNSSCFLVFELYMDWMSFMFFGHVSLISGAVFWYSGSYMSHDKRTRYFMILVLFFVVSMFFMVFSLNLISLMLGWDGLGVVSYILVVFYKNEKSSAAGMITALSNRVGDAALLLAIACMLEWGSWNFMMSNSLSDILLLSMVSLAAITKSAQIPFSAWLPAAMAAPTPVSALVHSSTLVTAGVYLLIRFGEILSGSVMMSVFTYLGMFTTLMASTSALFETDLKKIVALSTLSQLGIMIMTLALGFIELAFVHLLTHAVFKALLFMCSGKIIHSVGSNQDMRLLGGLFFNLPITGVLINFANYALCGIPFLAGFYSKDLLVESSLAMSGFMFKYLSLMFMVGLSASYSFRFSYFTTVTKFNTSSMSSSEDNDWIMLSSKSSLLVMTAMSGAFLVWTVFSVPYVISIGLSMKMLALTSTLMGAGLGMWLSTQKFPFLNISQALKVLEINMTMWFLPGLSGANLALSNFKLMKTLKTLDLGWMEWYGGQGINYFFLSGGYSISYKQMNKVSSFLLIFFVLLILVGVH